MIRILIIEDEIPARKKLKRFLNELDVSIELVAEIDNVIMAVEFLKSTTVDLIFSDIELLDGNAFDIYKQVSISSPIIFTTAYDYFWMNAFESNGIAYLLKPFSRERFEVAWNKFLLFRNCSPNENHQLTNLTKLIEQNFTTSYKKRITVNTHRGLVFIDLEDIAFLGTNEGAVFAFDTSGKKHLLNETTFSKVEGALNPSDFFRINRSEIVSKAHVERIERYSKNTIAIKLKGYTNYFKTSQSCTAAFRQWIEK